VADLGYLCRDDGYHDVLTPEEVAIPADEEPRTWITGIGSNFIGVGNGLFHLFTMDWQQFRMALADMP
jgi:hypothetical protein